MREKMQRTQCAYTIQIERRKNCYALKILKYDFNNMVYKQEGDTLLFRKENNLLNHINEVIGSTIPLLESNGKEF